MWAVELRREESRGREAIARMVSGGRTEAVIRVIGNPGTGRLGRPVDLEQVVGGADQFPLAVRGGQASSGDGADTSIVFDLGKDGLDARGSLLVGLAASGTVEFGDHGGGQRVGVTSPAPS